MTPFKSATQFSFHAGPAQVKLRDDQYSFQHVKAFGAANLLLLDPWNQNTVYYVSHDWNVMKTSVEMVSRPYIGPTRLHTKNIYWVLYIWAWLCIDVSSC
jgi:hypothetical protein